MNPISPHNLSASAGNSLEEVEVHIVGSNMLQNDLLRSFLEKELAVSCGKHRQLAQLSITTGNIRARRVVLIDCDAKETIDPWSAFGLNEFTDPNPPIFAFYNVHPEANLEQVAMERGIRGIFYAEESYEVLPRAITAILGGELWFSRKALSECVMNGDNHFAYSDAATNLTEREREILHMIATGASNLNISKAMGISLHTVKAHIYNIYKRLNLKGRLQASLWAAKYL